MFDALIKGINQLGDQNTRKPLWISIAVALGVFVVLWVVVGNIIEHTSVTEISWLEGIADAVGWLLVLIITLLLFPGVVSAVVALFLDQVATSVETRHYPDLDKAPGQPFAEGISGSVRFLGMMVLLNLLLLPFLLTGPIYAVLYYTVNGYLLGREYFELVAVRRISPDGVKALKKANSRRIWMTGVAVAFLLTIPIVNLLTPVIATSAMVHLFEKWRRSTPDGGQSMLRPVDSVGTPAAE